MFPESVSVQTSRRLSDKLARAIGLAAGTAVLGTTDFGPQPVSASVPYPSLGLLELEPEYTGATEDGIPLCVGYIGVMVPDSENTVSIRRGVAESRKTR